MIVAMWMGLAVGAFSGWQLRKAFCERVQRDHRAANLRSRREIAPAGRVPVQPAHRSQNAGREQGARVADFFGWTDDDVASTLDEIESLG